MMKRMKGPAPAGPQSYECVSSLKRINHNQLDDRKWAHGTTATGASGRARDRKVRARGPCWNLGRDRGPGFPSRLFKDNTSGGTGHNAALP